MAKKKKEKVICCKSKHPSCPNKQRLLNTRCEHSKPHYPDDTCTKWGHCVFGDEIELKVRCVRLPPEPPDNVYIIED